MKQSPIINGSFNFTRAAEKSNTKHLLILRDSEFAKRFTESRELHEGHSEVYKGR